MGMIKSGCKLLFGLSAFCLLRGNKQRCLKLIQGKYSWLLSGLLDSPLYPLFQEYIFLQDNKDSDKPTAQVLRDYAQGDSLLGYGDIEFKKYGGTIEEQKRGLILPRLDIKDGQVVVEIGIGNGDVLAHLAKVYPSSRFIGVDFSVKNAQIKHQLDNLRFVKGYAADLLQQGFLHGDMVFASSTFCLFAPGELRRYLALIVGAGFKHIVLNEPTWAGHRQKNNSDIVSKYMGDSAWYHNYCGYFRQAGFTIKHFEFYHYKPMKTWRSDSYVCLVEGIK